jgi:prophage maintenance system killer protein
MYVFLALNGQEIEAEETEVVELMVAIADGQRSESEVAAWLRQHTT